jgi:diacylglycerol kinase family enzyme
MNITLVYNPKSGSALSAHELRATCRDNGIVIDALIAIDDRLARKLAAAIKQGATIAAIGGDGTLSAVAGLVAGTKAVFAPLPGGTLNHFAKDLGVPQDVSEALASLARSKVRAIDVAEVNNVVFINNSSIGLYPSSLHERNRFEDRFGKWPASIIASIRAMTRFRTYIVTIGDETFRTPFVFVGNNKYEIDGIGGAKRSRLDKGVLSVFIAHTSSRAALMKIALHAVVGRAARLEEFDQRTVTSLTIATKRNRLSVSRDGEVNRMASPLKFEALPGALKIRY